jgi:hypothetical protein
MSQLRSTFKFVLMLNILHMFGHVALGDQYEISGGYFQIEAVTSENKATVSNAGLIELAYCIEFTSSIALKPGYSLYLFPASGAGSDIGYGLDIGLKWYPFSQAPVFRISSGGTRWTYAEIIRPYLVLSFHQRQYQSIQSSYAGLGLSVGSEFVLPLSFLRSLYGVVDFSSIDLNGPLNSTITETQYTFGIGSYLF